MPRDLAIGNGRLLVNFDSRYQLRDIYFPNVGEENQTMGHPCRFGVWVGGKFSWTDDDNWQRTLTYLPDTLVTKVQLVNASLQVELTCFDAVDLDEAVLVRRVVVENSAEREREVRLFFHHDFHISQNAVGDTAYYKPDFKAIIHYKGPRYFLISGLVGSEVGPNQWATGAKEVGGHEGTWRDAEDGVLGGNPIKQGSVDSCVAFHVPLEAHGNEVIYVWLIASTSYDALKALHQAIVQKGPHALLSRTTHFWYLWANKEDYDYGPLPPELVTLFKRSLLTIRTNVDNDGGIIAATDSDIKTFSFDTYSYIWPRDGALVSHALDQAGYPEISRPFFELCSRIITDEGFFLHKYNADGTLASSWHPWLRDGQTVLPIQEDETGLVLWALWYHFDKYRDIEFIKPLYEPLIMRAADFLVLYRDERGLPSPSWDLWEERWGVHAFTIGAVYGGLIAASNFARSFGELDEARHYRRIAHQLRAAADQYLWREELGRFARALYPGKDGVLKADPVIDSALIGLFSFGMYEATDSRLVATLNDVQEELRVNTDVGGIARYMGDYYHQVSQDIERVPGNPWFICALWLAQWQIACAQSIEALRPILNTLGWVQHHALPSGILAEQMHPFTGIPLSVSPLTWSHAVYVTTIIEYLDRYAELITTTRGERPIYAKEEPRLRHQRAHHHKPSDEETTPGQLSASQSKEE